MMRGNNRLGLAIWVYVDNLLFSFVDEMKREDNGTQKNACS